MTAGEFLALPVSLGDAFFLRRASGLTVLVDGGLNRETLAQLFAHWAKVDTLDVVACTHADADHVNGLIGLLETARVKVKEVWLPGRWTDRLADLLLDPLEFFAEVNEQVTSAPSDVDLETYAARFDRPSQPPNDSERRPEDRTIWTVEKALTEEGQPVLDGPWLSMRRWWGRDDARAKLWVDAVTTAERIVQLALAACHHGARIRWFDHGEYLTTRAPSGGTALLQPKNSVELDRCWASRHLEALHWLSLSVSNRESLVFYAPETRRESGVYFTADSNLENAELPSAKRRLLVTTPHHGSEANDPAYARLGAHHDDLRWVRSDGNVKKRPGEGFLRLPRASRWCTLCRSATSRKQCVQIFDAKGGWNASIGTDACSCA